MGDELSDSKVEALWQGQPTEPPHISPEDLRRKMDRFERRIYWRNVREYVAGAFVVAAFGYYEWRFPTVLMRIGSGLMILGTLYVMYELHRRASARTAPAELGMSTCLDFHRRELERQRDALRSVWTWYLLPFVPGMIVFLAGMAWIVLKANPAVMLRALIGLGVMGIVVAAVFFAVWKLNRWTANKLQSRIDALNALTRDTD
jgi:hypothetical protein